MRKGKRGARFRRGIFHRRLIFDRFRGRHARFWEKPFRASEAPFKCAEPVCNGGTRAIRVRVCVCVRACVNKGLRRNRSLLDRGTPSAPAPLVYPPLAITHKMQHFVSYANYPFRSPRRIWHRDARTFALGSIIFSFFLPGKRNEIQRWRVVFLRKSFSRFAGNLKPRVSAKYKSVSSNICNLLNCFSALSILILS